MNGLEIERKFLIDRPDPAVLAACGEASQIIQTYLETPDGDRYRLRRRSYPDRTEYTKTEKQDLTARTRAERESALTAAEYEAALRTDRVVGHPVRKTRYCVQHNGRLFEIDLYAFWEDRAILEIELDAEDADFELPTFVRVRQEVTDDANYRNSALALRQPEDYNKNGDGF